MVRNRQGKKKRTPWNKPRGEGRRVAASGEKLLAEPGGQLGDQPGVS